MPRANNPLSRRERQVMDVLHRMEQATVAALSDQLNGDMSYSAVRSVLRVLVKKGKARRKYDGPRYVYAPAVRPAEARGRALDHLVRTFFGGSFEEAAVALLRRGDTEITEQAVRQLRARIRHAQKEGR
jgi:predicted transcriptional regulator